MLEKVEGRCVALLCAAICDDNDVFCEILREMVSAHFTKCMIEHSIRVYHSIEAIRYDLLEGSRFDILFLDIEFAEEKEDGVKLAKYIRNVLHDEYPEIVYVSGQEKYAMKLFETRPLHFLIKPIEEKEVVDVLEKMTRIREVRKKFFTYSSGTRRYCIELGKILYFTSEGRKVRIVSSDQEERFFYGKLSGVVQELCHNNFFSPHKSYAVNYFCVEQWGRNELVVSNGDRIPISRNREAEVRSLQLQYERGLF